MNDRRCVEELKKRTGEVESIVDSYLPAEEGYQKTIFEAMNYSVTGWRKTPAPHAHAKKPIGCLAVRRKLCNPSWQPWR